MRVKLLTTMVIDGSVEFPYYDIDVHPDELAQELIDAGKAVAVADAPAGILDKVQPQKGPKHGKESQTPANGQGNTSYVDARPSVIKEVKRDA